MRYRTAAYWMIVAVVCLAWSCSKASGDEETASRALATGEQGVYEPEPASETSPGDLPPADPMRIVTATVAIEVESFEEAMDAIRAEVERVDGHVGATRTERDEDGRMSGSIELRVPAKSYEDVLDALVGMGEMQDMQEDAQDVSEEYVDLGARLSNQRKLEERILGLLEEGTGSIDDVLAVEKELGAVREDIERIEGRMRWLESRSATSSITVSLWERGASPVGESSGAELFGSLMDRVGKVFLGSLGVLVTLVVAVTPWAAAIVLLALGILVVVRLAGRRRSPAPA